MGVGRRKKRKIKDTVPVRWMPDCCKMFLCFVTHLYAFQSTWHLCSKHRHYLTQKNGNGHPSQCRLRETKLFARERDHRYGLWSMPWVEINLEWWIPGLIIAGGLYQSYSNNIFYFLISLILKNEVRRLTTTIFFLKNLFYIWLMNRKYPLYYAIWSRNVCMDL